ncbi:regulator of G-protein signaling 22 isoform X2 [Vanacampus margaritifer]
MSLVMHGEISTEFPQITVHNFENFLTSDHLFVHMLNQFLSLPCFPQALLYNQETDQFEVPSDAAEFTFNKIRSALEHSKSRLLYKDVEAPAKTALVDNRYTVSCLDREQGIQWFIKERLSFFLQSSCYHEYRLSKWLFQWTQNINIHRRPCSSRLATAMLCDKENGKTGLGAQSPKQGCVKIHQPLCTSPGHSGQLHRNVSESSRCSSKGSKQSTTSSMSSTSFTSNLIGADINIREASAASHEKLHEEASERYLQDLAARVVQQVVVDAVFILTAQRQGSTNDLTGWTETDKNGKCIHSVDENTKEPREECQKWSQENEMLDGDKTKVSEGSWSSDLETVLDVCCHGTCHLGNQPGMDDFKEFLRCTPGGRLLNLWMDIERLKTINRERKDSFLALMRSRYLLRSSQNCLNMELLCRLGLTTSPCWTRGRLCSIQPYLTQSIISYWIPRYWTSQHVQLDLDYSDMEPLREWCANPHLTSMTPHSFCTEPWLPSRSQSLGCTRLENIFQALFVDPDAGSYFTHFCEQSGNKLWEDAVYFWNDLQHYHELFYQDGLDPYRVQRVAQVLYSTYLHSSASRSIGVEEEIRKEVYNKLMPAFEELFDKVSVYEDVRCVNTWQYRELQSLYAESKNFNQVHQRMTSASNTSSRPFSQGQRALDSWSNVPPQYQGYRLGSLLRHHHEIWHFMSFLRNKDASIHLECWLDLEQYRRTPWRNTALRQERSSHIAKKYLNGNYFFSPHSPATEEQQNNILHQAGGLGRLEFECLSKPVTVEIQDIIRCHIEKKWLPQFLATAKFTERRKRKPKDSSQRQKSRKEGWKTQSLWMSSSKEILLFRRLLLNPVFCLQFQHFVSPKGGLLENDVLFWLEVQRYKDLCHSHSAEATIQQKISTIIKCFINSSTPPALQIDIPLEQAQHIMDNRHQLGPYIFREAQMSVFSELLRFWPNFQELRSSVHEGQLLEMLQDERVKHKARVRRQRRKEEEEDERRAQEDVNRLACSSSEDEDMRNYEKRRGENRASKTPSGFTLLSPKPFSWSYSKYMAGLKRDEALLRRQSQKDASFSTYSVSSDSSKRSTDGHKRTSRRSSKSHVKQCW